MPIGMLECPPLLLQGEKLDQVREIINVIRLKRGFPPLDSICKNDQLRDDLGLDSLDLAELAVKVEAKLNIDIFKDGIVDTYGDIHNLLMPLGMR